MQRYGWLVIALATACGGKTKPAPLSNHGGSSTDFTPTTKPFPALATADFVVTASSGDLLAYALEGDTPKLLGTLTLQAIPDDEETRALSKFGSPSWWIDRDHLMVHGAAGNEVWIVSTAGGALLAVPPDNHFASVPKPVASNGEDADEQGVDGDVTGMVGQLWWDHCAWGANEDGELACFADTYTRIWPPDPSMTFVQDAPKGLGNIFLPTWKDTAPAFTITQDRDTNNNMPSCTAGTTTVAMPSSTQQELGGAVHWMDGGALVEYGSYGMADFYMAEYALYDKCTDKPIAVGGRYQLLQDGLWLGADLKPATIAADVHKYRYVIRKGLKVVAEIPSYRDVAWRPAK